MHSHAQELPLWEFGLGAGVLTANDYRGAKNRSTYAAPIPYFVYRGENLRFDRDGLRGTFFNQDRVKLNISINGSIPADSDDNKAREGMPDLLPTLEVGPSMEVTLYQQKSHRARIMLPLRGVLATNIRENESIGWVFYPHLNLDMPQSYKKWEIGFNIGPLFASQKYNDYYYSVAPEYVTQDRPAYEASAGFSGTSTLLNATRRGRNFWFSVFVRYDNLSGATFQDSPLVETEDYLMGGIAMTWNFARSKRTIGTSEIWR
jgi:outer membrane scaffolding protein for murein synthesis (MipA/OmpV family)